MQSMKIVNKQLMTKTHSSGSEYCSMVLHSLLHGQSEGSSGGRAVGEPQLVEVSNGGFAGAGAQFGDLFAGFVIFSNGVSASTTKDNQIQKRVGSQSVSSVNGSASSFTGGVKAGNDLVCAIFVCDDLRKQNKQLHKM